MEDYADARLRGEPSEVHVILATSKSHFLRINLDGVQIMVI